MIQQPNGNEAPREVDTATLRCVALKHLLRQAWAASESQDTLADLLGETDNPANRKMLAKIFQNLGRTP